MRKGFASKASPRNQVGVGAEKETKLVVWFTNDERGLVLNKTNNRTLRGAFGDAVDGWISKVVAVFPTMVDMRGKMVPALRVQIPPPKQQQPATTTAKPAPSGNGAAASPIHQQPPAGKPAAAVSGDPELDEEPRKPLRRRMEDENSILMPERQAADLCRAGCSTSRSAVGFEATAAAPTKASSMKNELLADALALLRRAGVEPQVTRSRHWKLSWIDRHGRARLLVVSFSQAITAPAGGRGRSCESCLHHEQARNTARKSGSAAASADAAAGARAMGGVALDAEAGRVLAKAAIYRDAAGPPRQHQRSQHMDQLRHRLGGGDRPGTPTASLTC